MTESILTEGIQPNSYVPLRVQVYGALRDAITSGKLKPGERIVEDRICAELGVSRSPLREALRKLEGEGLVSILPRRGAIVTELTTRDQLELFAVREALEGLAANLAASNITGPELAELEDICLAMEKCISARDMATVVTLNTQFHELIAKASRNRWVREFLVSIRAQTRRLYRSAIEKPDRAAESVAEHRLVIDALRQGDGPRADGLARQHVLAARDVASASSPR